MGELYFATFPNGKGYIGITTKTAEKRLIKHVAEARRNKHSIILFHKAIRKYGIPNIATLAILENKELANAEIKAIIVYKTLVPNGYNLAFGGQISPMHNPIVAAKVSATKKGMKIPDAQIAKMHAARKKYVPTLADRAKLSAALHKRYERQEERDKTGNAFRGKQLSVAHKKKISEANLGAKNGMFGKILSEATRAKMSAAAKRRCERPEERARLTRISRRRIKETMHETA